MNAMHFFLFFNSSLNFFRHSLKSPTDLNCKKFRQWKPPWPFMARPRFSRATMGLQTTEQCFRGLSLREGLMLIEDSA